MLEEYIKSYCKRVDEEQLFSVLESYRSSMQVNITRIDFDKMEKWNFSPNEAISHESGKFFSIIGAEAYDKEEGITRHQPIINQPEQGILGIASRTNEGQIELLLQAKIEPGNLDSVQYSPTVQATKSNYTGAHKGKSVAYIDTFLENSSKIKSRGYQSEHGYKFYKKANDNVHAHDDDITKIDNKFAWLSFGDVRYMLSKEHCINMDTRSVLATIDFFDTSVSSEEIHKHSSLMESELTPLEAQLLFSSLSEDGAQNSVESISNWLSLAKDNKQIEHKTTPLAKLYEHGWKVSDGTLHHEKNKNFELVGIRASIGSREVSSWCQPIVRDNVPKVYGFILKEINNIIHVLVQLVEEDFSWNGAELGPTFHSIDSSTFSLDEELAKFDVISEQSCTFYDCFQSEEGGRFMEQKNRYMLINLDKNSTVEVSNRYKWVTLYQLKKMTSYECSVNIEARTLLALASYYKEN
tara:strand:+ start:7479 stop:8879 length:1401 start_codon:yes stop_codon:yes gene_type:complete